MTISGMLGEVPAASIFVPGGGGGVGENGEYLKKSNRRDIVEKKAIGGCSGDETG